MSLIRIAQFLAIALVLGVSNPVRAGLITNGDFSSYTAGAIVPNNHYLIQVGNDPTVNGNGSLSGKGTLTDWTIYNGTYTDNTHATSAYAYLFSTTNQTYLHQAATAPPKGTTTFLGLSSDNGFVHSVNSVQQTINGLTAGQSYAVSFDWAATQTLGADGNYSVGWEVSLGGGTAQDTTVLSETAQTTSAWRHESFTFTATSSSEVLKFLSVSPVVYGPPSALLTNVDMESVAVPEPSTLVSLGLGCIAFIAIGFRRRARALKSA